MAECVRIRLLRMHRSSQLGNDDDVRGGGLPGMAPLSMGYMDEQAEAAVGIITIEDVIEEVTSCDPGS